MSFRPQTYFFVAGSIVGVSLLTVICQPVVARQMNEWQLLPRPERMTELYFTDYRDIPAPDSSNPKQMVMFTVHNVEHRTTTYRYELTAKAESSANEQVMGSGSFTLEHGHFLTTTEDITPLAAGRRTAVSVNLEYEGIALGATAPSSQRQSIHYWFNGQKEKHENART